MVNLPVLSTVTNCTLLAIFVYLIAYTAVRVGCWYVPEGDDLLTRATVIGCASLIEIVAMFQLLGLASILRTSTTLLGAAIFAIAARQLLPAPEKSVFIEKLREIAMPVKLIFALSLGYVLAVSAGATTDTDSLLYHALNAAHWATSHSLLTLPFSQTGAATHDNPGNGELVALSTILPSAATN